MESFDQIGNFSQSLKDKLSKLKITFLLFGKETGILDGTEKYLFRLEDENYLECVLMRYQGTKSKQRNTLWYPVRLAAPWAVGFVQLDKVVFNGI